MKKIVLWSGGGDSTLLLYNIAKKYPDETIYAIFYNNALFKKYNSIAINKFSKLIKIFNDMGINNIDFKENILLYDLTNIKYPQKHACIPLAYHFDLIQHFDEDTTVYQGFIKEDAELHNKYLFFELYELFSKFLDLNLKLEFPLEYISKIEVIEQLIELGINKDVIYCVHLDALGNACNECRNCLMQEMGISGILVKKYNKNILSMLSEEYKLKW